MRIAKALATTIAATMMLLSQGVAAQAVTDLGVPDEVRYIGPISRNGCTVSLPITVKKPGVYIVSVWDEFKVLDSFKWEARTAGLETHTWQIKGVTENDHPGISFALDAANGKSYGWRDYEYPDEVGFACAALNSGTALKPIDCSTPKIFVAQGEDATTLKAKEYDAEAGVNTADASFAALGGPWTGTKQTTRYNAIAYNDQDGYIYGLADTANGGVDLVKVGDQGVVQVIGEVKGIPHDQSFRNNGSFLAGKYYFSTDFSNVIYSLDLKTLETTSISLSQTWEPSDFVEIDGFLWGIIGWRIYRLDVTTGKVSRFSIGNLIGGSSYGAGGAVFRYANGDFGVISSDTNAETQIHITNPASAKPTFSLVGQTSAPTSGRNDGTSCSAK